MPMAAYELSKEWIKKNGEKIKEAYSSATSRGLDIFSKADVFELLKIIDPVNATEENAEIFSKVLQLFALGVKKKFEATKKVKEKVIN